MSGSGLEALGELIERGGDVDDVLRGVVRTLSDQPGIAWAGIGFLENGEVVVGPASGEADVTRRRSAVVSFQGAPVGEVIVDGDLAQGELELLADLVAPYVLLGWDTYGETWDP